MERAQRYRSPERQRGCRCPDRHQPTAAGLGQPPACTEHHHIIHRRPCHLTNARPIEVMGASPRRPWAAATAIAFRSPQPWRTIVPVGRRWKRIWPPRKQRRRVCSRRMRSPGVGDSAVGSRDAGCSTREVTVSFKASRIRWARSTVTPCCSFRSPQETSDSLRLRRPARFSCVRPWAIRGATRTPLTGVRPRPRQPGPPHPLVPLQVPGPIS
jgi:hypothetical protein